MGAKIIKVRIYVSFLFKENRSDILYDVLIKFCLFKFINYFRIVYYKKKSKNETTT